MGKFIDLTGQRFGRLTVLSRAEDDITASGKHWVKWLCQCDCGNTKSIRSKYLTSGRIQSCGCKRKDIGYTKKTKNQYKIYQTYAVIQTSKNDEIIIDIDDINICKQHTWFIHDGYPTAKINGKQVRLHKFLVNVMPGILVDHKNGNPLDNRRDNLRVCLPCDNAKNVKARDPDRISGVTYNKSNDKWMVRISIDGKETFLGYYETQEEANKVRLSAEDKYYGEFGYYNSRIKPKENKEEIA